MRAMVRRGSAEKRERGRVGHVANARARQYVPGAEGVTCLKIAVGGLSAILCLRVAKTGGCCPAVVWIGKLLREMLAGLFMVVVCRQYGEIVRKAWGCR